MRRPSLTAVTVACFVVGAAVLVVFEHAVTLALGVVLLLAFIVLGLFLIASPDYLGKDPEEG